MNGRRARILKSAPPNSSKGPVLYWMQRSQRIHDNWSLLYAAEYAKKIKQPLFIVFNLFPDFLDATIRQFDFMLKGLDEVSRQAKELNYPFFILYGNPVENLLTFINNNQIQTLFTDFNPLKLIQKTKLDLVSKLQIQVIEVDSSNVVPAWIASPKLEFAAYTLRPKVHKLLPEFLTDIPNLQPQSLIPPQPELKNITVVSALEGLEKLNVDRSVPPVRWLKPGYNAGMHEFHTFLTKRFLNYSVDRNNPNLNSQSNMSPYLHYGQISAQRLAFTVSSHLGAPESSKNTFLEELIVRRELADNYCYYNPNYDNFNGFHEWAKQTLNQHRFDKREFLYSKPEFETAKTHDPLWNAAQRQLVKEGKMHGFMRMYWAKKILEWTSSPEEAQEIAIYLNDKYELDGIDPNGYTGINWSIGGVHDRAWTERPVFGKIRYMNYAGCKRKFDVIAFQDSYSSL